MPKYSRRTQHDCTVFAAFLLDLPNSWYSHLPDEQHAGPVLSAQIMLQVPTVSLHTTYLSHSNEFQHAELVCILLQVLIVLLCIIANGRNSHAICISSFFTVLWLCHALDFVSCFHSRNVTAL